MDDQPMKCCTKCKQKFPATAEYFFVRKETGKLRNDCKQCNNKSRQERYSKNAKIERERQRGRRRADPKKYRERDKKRKNKEERKVKNREHYWKDHDRRLAKMRTDRAIHGERYNANRRKKNADGNCTIKKVDPDKDRVYKNNRRTRKSNLPSDLSIRDWRRALLYFSNRCVVCGRTKEKGLTLAADHWIPISDPRPHNPGTVPGNILPLCHGRNGCNNTKKNFDPVKWLIQKFGAQEAQKILDRIQRYFDWIKDYPNHD